MSLGRRQAEQKSMWLSYDQLSQSQGHVFYERLVNSNCKCTGEGLVKNLSGSLVV